VIWPSHSRRKRRGKNVNKKREFQVLSIGHRDMVGDHAEQTKGRKEDARKGRIRSPSRGEGNAILADEKEVRGQGTLRGGKEHFFSGEVEWKEIKL